MIEGIKNLLDTFDALPETERQEVLAELPRRMVPSDYQEPNENELVAAADAVFRDLDDLEQGFKVSFSPWRDDSPSFTHGPLGQNLRPLLGSQLHDLPRNHLRRAPRIV